MMRVMSLGNDIEKYSFRYERYSAERNKGLGRSVGGRIGI